MKIIVIGTSASGKTTLIRYLRNSTKLPISEIDAELTTLNGGEFPIDDNLKKNVLAPKIFEDIINRDEIIFFTNTDYFFEADIRKAKDKGFKIFQLDLSLEDLIRRNQKRVKEEGYPDINQWLAGMVEYQTEIRKTGLVDLVIDASKPTEKIANELLDNLN